MRDFEAKALEPTAETGALRDLQLNCLLKLVLMAGSSDLP
jgi:hypothetical protein